MVETADVAGELGLGVTQDGRPAAAVTLHSLAAFALDELALPQGDEAAQWGVVAELRGGASPLDLRAAAAQPLKPRLLKCIERIRVELP